MNQRREGKTKKNNNKPSRKALDKTQKEAEKTQKTIENYKHIKYKYNHPERWPEKSKNDKQLTITNLQSSN